MAEYGISNPTIESDSHWFSVTFPRLSKVTEKVTDNQAMILASMKESRSISSAALAETVGISDLDFQSEEMFVGTPDAE